jgi:hypothetical protein
MFTVSFSTDNDAFMNMDGDPNPSQEIGRILTALVQRVDDLTEDDCGNISDHNGNVIGEWSYTEED